MKICTKPFYVRYCRQLSFDAKPVNRKLVRTMTRVLHHGGPDDERFYFDGSIGLGYRRLSLIDLKSGHQPMTNATDHLDMISNIYSWNVLWVADSFTLVSHSSNSIDRPRLIKCKNDPAHIFALCTALHYLFVVLGAPIPENILNDLMREKVSRRTYLYFSATVCPLQTNSEHPFVWLRELWFSYCRIIPSKNFLLNLAGFSLYLKYRWRLNRWWEFPLVAVTRLIARIVLRKKIKCV